MDYLDEKTFQNWLAGAKVLEQDDFGLKVLALEDGTFLKLFRIKRLVSSQRLFPQALRFARNAERLRLRGVPCPEVIATWKLKTPPRNLVHYHPLPGETLRDLRQRDPRLWQTLLPRLAGFISGLHEKGVYFRSLHLGNIVLTPDDELGLIDISDMRFLNRPLPRHMRKRNYKRLMQYPQDWTETPTHLRALLRP